MNDIDKLIKKYGYQFLISEIVRREQASIFLKNFQKRGAPRIFLDDLWGLQDVCNHFYSMYPNEKQEYIADRVINFINHYRAWEKQPNIYTKELDENKTMYEKVKWLGSYSGKSKKRNPIKPKTIVNKMKKLRKETLRIAEWAIADSFTLNISTVNLMKNEVFVDDPRDFP